MIYDSRLMNKSKKYDCRYSHNREKKIINEDLQFKKYYFPEWDALAYILTHMLIFSGISRNPGLPGARPMAGPSARAADYTLEEIISTAAPTV